VLPDNAVGAFIYSKLKLDPVKLSPSDKKSAEAHISVSRKNLDEDDGVVVLQRVPEHTLTL